MRTRSMYRVALMLILGAAVGTVCACLDPLVDDDVDPHRAFGDPDVTPGEVLHVEDDPMFASHVTSFSTSVAFLHGFAEGSPIWYWNVDGPNAEFIAPMFVVVDSAGHPLGRPIIDALPGDPGYTPWWRRVLVRTTETYAGERIWSRAAIDAGVKLGILEPPVEDSVVTNCPVIRRDARVPVGEGKSVEPTWGWYRGRRVSWVDFTEPYPVPTGVREMPSFPVYVLQRVDEPQPIYELLIGRDLTGDSDLDDTNNIFPSKVGGERYSPLWYVTLVRTVADYRSVDNSTTTPDLTAERQFVSPSGDIISPLVVPNGLTTVRSFLVNCSLQREKGKL